LANTNVIFRIAAPRKGRERNRHCFALYCTSVLVRIEQLRRPAGWSSKDDGNVERRDAVSGTDFAEKMTMRSEKMRTSAVLAAINRTGHWKTLQICVFGSSSRSGWGTKSCSLLSSPVSSAWLESNLINFVNGTASMQGLRLALIILSNEHLQTKHKILPLDSGFCPALPFLAVAWPVYPQEGGGKDQS
jgi:hypothetical protein